MRLRLIRLARRQCQQPAHQTEPDREHREDAETEGVIHQPAAQKHQHPAPERADLRHRAAGDRQKRRQEARFQGKRYTIDKAWLENNMEAIVEPEDLDDVWVCNDAQALILKCLSGKAGYSKSFEM